jgi:hypothetical protein
VGRMPERTRDRMVAVSGKLRERRGLCQARRAGRYNAGP